MAIYENLSPNGHYTMAQRIFYKIKGWVESKVQTDVPANAVFTDHIYTAGDNVNITNDVISSDQIEDGYNYTQYQALPDSVKMQDKIFMVKNAPKPKVFSYDPDTKTIIMQNGYASYNSATKTISIGG